MREVPIYHGHVFCGLGGGAKGMNAGRAVLGNLRAKFICAGGIDVSAPAIADFQRLTGVQGTVMDLFTREQYIRFHGKEPPPGWVEATPAMVRAAFTHRPHIGFMSSPCKGFTGLLSEIKSQSARYVALNELALRGLWLLLEAFADDPIELIINENVPRIATRGRPLVDRMIQIERHFGYASAETTHDCGEIGNLAQTRKRWLLVGRHVAKVPPSLYVPEKKPLRAVGDVLGRFPLPGDMTAGPMHRIPSLQFKTWVRLAFVEAGSDWRSLNRLEVKDGFLRDYLLVPDRRDDFLGVTPWDHHAATISTRGGATNGRYSVADPRVDDAHHGVFGVRAWDKPSACIQGASRPANGRFVVADPRIKQSAEYGQLGVRQWSEATGAVTGQSTVGGGAHAVADPRVTGAPRYNYVLRVVHWDRAAGAVTSADGGKSAVADPRPHAGPLFSKYPVAEWKGKPSGTVIGGDDMGAYGVADPRAPQGGFNGKGKYITVPWEGHAGAVLAGSTTGQGAFTVADPRPDCLKADGDQYATQGHYGVVPWDRNANVVAGNARHDNGYNSVADPRMPAASDKVVCLIRALDGTWHRPFTTLELAALQGLVDPEEHLQLEGLSDSAWRERIGNAVPAPAAAAIASVMGRTLLGAWTGETFRLTDEPIWVRPIAIAIAASQ